MGLEMPFRYPDDPVRCSLNAFRELEQTWPGRWIGFPKKDGWRRVGYLVNGTWAWHAKHSRESIPMPATLEAEFAGMGWPDGIALDCEWVGRRCVADLGGRNELWVIDMLYLGGQWQGMVPFEERFSSLATIFELAARKAPAPSVFLMRGRREGLAGMFEAQKADPISEGLVLRHVRGTLVGGTRGPVDNGSAMMKVKYRDIHEPVGI